MALDRSAAPRLPDEGQFTTGLANKSTLITFPPGARKVSFRPVATDARVTFAPFADNTDIAANIGVPLDKDQWNEITLGPPNLQIIERAKQCSVTAAAPSVVIWYIFETAENTSGLDDT